MLIEIILLIQMLFIPQVNPGRQGFYRVNYTFDLFSLLLPALKDGSLSAQDRLGLQSDAFALVRCGHWRKVLV